jgi:Tat protein translocase TatB subunit
MFGLGFWEILIILVVALLVLGPERLPEVAKTLGRSMAQLRHAADDLRDELSSTREDLENTLKIEESDDHSKTSAEETDNNATTDSDDSKSSEQ